MRGPRDNLAAIVCMKTVLHRDFGQRRHRGVIDTQRLEMPLAAGNFLVFLWSAILPF
jgi:hypothetical protein